jgi:hypothetical protein
MVMQTIAQNGMTSRLWTRFLTFIRTCENAIETSEFVVQCWIRPCLRQNDFLHEDASRAYRLPQLISDGWAVSITSGKDTKWRPVTYILNQGTSFSDRLQWLSRRIGRLLYFHARHDSIIMMCWGNTSRKNRAHWPLSRMARPAMPLLSIPLSQNDSQVGRQLYTAVTQPRQTISTLIGSFVSYLTILYQLGRLGSFEIRWRNAYFVAYFGRQVHIVSAD